MALRKRIGIVSFNANERDAVDALLSDLANGAPSPWARVDPNAIERTYGDEVWHIQHVPLLAQGNVIAAATLAEFFADRDTAPDYVIFFGCAGAVDSTNEDSVYLVREVSYMSLGTVEDGGNGVETITLKNKWLCHLSPASDSGPLEALSFPLCDGTGGPIDVPEISRLATARVAATDKVVRIRASDTAPVPTHTAPPHPKYEKREWTYGEGLAYASQNGDSVLVEMESYGIAAIADALQILDRVVVLRVTTDVLSDQATSDSKQAQMLHRARRVLGHLVRTLFVPGMAGT